ncbi:hypothetical protein [Nitrosomonas sp. JL21]|nr:hypothetical protein [Nitrosomonas sp. JL21]
MHRFPWELLPYLELPKEILKNYSDRVQSGCAHQSGIKHRTLCRAF